MTQRVVFSTNTLNKVHGNQSLEDFLPKEVVTFLRTNDRNSAISNTSNHRLTSGSTNQTNSAESFREQEFQVACLFADICNFTKLSEDLAKLDTRGVELLAHYLNSCFTQMVRLVSKAGGDVFKFAGDAVIVLWPVTAEDEYSLETATRRAVQCALDIQATLPSKTFFQGLSLSVKIGIGCGTVKILHVGGEMDSDRIARKEYIALGNPLMQAFAAESCCKAGQVVLSPESHLLVQDFFKPIHVDPPLAAGNVRISPTITNRLKLRRRARGVESVPPAVLSYLPRSVQPFLALDHSKKDWISEMRLVTVLFINFGFDKREIVNLSSCEGSKTLHNCFRAVQRVVFDYEGTINKFLVDDKGVTTLAVFGLPPLAHENDAARGVLASLGIGTLLHEMQLRPAIGVASGSAFCGVIGQLVGRKEYTVIGDTVNLAARLVQHAQRESLLVITDKMTQYLSKGTVDFERLPDSIKVKGKAKEVHIYFPYRAHQQTTHEQQPNAPLGQKGKSHTAQGTDRMSMQLLSFKRGERLGEVNTAEQGRGMDTWRVEWQEQVNRYTERRKRSLTNVGTNYFVTPVGEEGQDGSQSMGKTVMEILDGGSGVSVVLQGEIGLGKTRVLSQLRRTLVRNGDMVFCCAGNPFEKGSLSRPFGVWIDIVNEAIDIQLSRLDKLDQDEESIPTSSSKPSMNAMLLQPGDGTKVRKLPPRSPVSVTIRAGSEQSPTRVLEHMETRQMLGVSPGTRAPRNRGKEVTRPQHWDDPVRRQWVLQSMLEVALLHNKKHQHVIVEDHTAVSSNRKTASSATSDTATRAVACTARDWCLLNPLFGVSFPHDKEVNRSPESHRKEVLKSLFELIFLGINDAANRVVCLIDDAMYLDVDSLQVTLLLAQAAHVSLVVALRPIDMHSFPVPLCRELCESLANLSNCKMVEMQPLSNAQIRTLARSTLGVLSIPLEVEAALSIKSRGNPLFVLEMLRDMRDNGILRVDKHSQTCYTNTETATPLQSKDVQRCHKCQSKFSAIKRGHNCKRCGQVFCQDCAPQNQRRAVLGYDTPQRMCNDCFAACAVQESIGCMSNAKEVAANILNLDIHPPVSVVKVLGTWLDHLAVSQQLMLKIASVASVARNGLRFSRQVVIQAFPIPDVPSAQVEQDFDQLVSLRLIRAVYNPDTATSSGFSPTSNTPPSSASGQLPLLPPHLGHGRGSLVGASIAEEGENNSGIANKLDTSVILPTSPISTRRERHNSTFSMQSGSSFQSGATVEQRKSQLLEAFQTPWQQSFEFVHYLMPELMHLRMTSVQQEDLRNRVTELQAEHERELRLLFHEKSGAHIRHMNLKSGFISVSKHNPAIKGLVGGQWKKRFAVIKESRMFLYGSRHDEIAKEELLLSGAKVAPHPMGKHALSLTVDWVSKAGTLQDGPRSFVITFPEAEHPQDDCTSWEYMLKFAIEMADPSLSDSPTSNVPPAPVAVTSGKSARSRAKAGTAKLFHRLHRRRASFGFARTGRAKAQPVISPPSSPSGNLSQVPNSVGKRLTRNRNRSWFGGSAADTRTWDAALAAADNLESMGLKMQKEEEDFEYDAVDVRQLAQEARRVRMVSPALRNRTELASKTE